MAQTPFKARLGLETPTGQDVNSGGDIKINGVSINTGGTLDNVFYLDTQDMDDVANGSTYVKTENNLTDSLKTNYDSAYTHSTTTTGNPHSVTKTDVGLGNVVDTDTTNADNISDGTTNAIITLTQEANFETAYSKSHDQNTDTGTSSDDFSIGDGTDTDKTISIDNGNANAPQLKYNASTNTWQYSNNGTTFNDMGSGSGGSTEVVYLEVTQASHGFDSDFVYNNGTTWVKAQADSEATTATHFAVRIDDNTFNAVIIGEVDVTGLLDDNGQALVNNTFYFLSQTVAGKLATTEPKTGIKQVVIKTNTTNNATISIEIPFNLAGSANIISNNNSILSSSWVDDTGVSGYWYADIGNANISPTDSVEVNFQLASIPNTTTILSVTQSFSGYVRIYSTEAVSSNLTADLVVQKEGIVMAHGRTNSGVSGVESFEIAALKCNIGEGLKYGGYPFGLVEDDNYIYAGGSTYTIRKYNKSNSLLVAESSKYGGYIYALVGDDNYIYAGGGTPYTIRKYNKSDLSLVTESSAYGGYIHSLAEDDNYIYAGGGTTQAIKKYNKSNLSLVTESSAYGGFILSLAEDDNYIYAGGDKTQTIRKYNKGDLSLVAESPSYGGAIRTLAEDDNYIYAGGDKTQTIRKYTKASLLLVAESPSYGGAIRTLAEDDNYIYAGGETTQTIRKYNKSHLSFVAESLKYGESIYGLVGDDNYIYAGGSTIRKYNKQKWGVIKK